jgi:RNA polymerase sigma factor (sigma-70 family)
VDLLDKLAKHHNDWCRIVTSFGCPAHIVEDIVQEMYLKLHKYQHKKPKYINEDGNVNPYYIYAVLRSLYIDYQKAKAKITIVNEIKDDVDYMYSLEYEHEVQQLNNKVFDEINTWHWYDAKLCKLYWETDMSMRDISKSTKISLRSIFNTIKNGRHRLQENFKEDYLYLKKIKNQD